MTAEGPPPDGPLPDGPSPDAYPWWVKAGLSFARSRDAHRLLALFWAVGVIACVALMYMTEDGGVMTLLFIGSLGSLVFAALHRATQRWVDANGVWPDS